MMKSLKANMCAAVIALAGCATFTTASHADAECLFFKVERVILNHDDHSHMGKTLSIVAREHGASGPSHVFTSAITPNDPDNLTFDNQHDAPFLEAMMRLATTAHLGDQTVAFYIAEDECRASGSNHYSLPAYGPLVGIGIIADH